jgi:hypothetical protein
MDSYAGAMRGLVVGQVILPTEAQCQGCGYFDIRVPEVQDLMAEAGRQLIAASRPRSTACTEGEACVATWPD